jgi:hypothetical protein
MGKCWFKVFYNFNLSHGDLFDGIGIAWDYKGHEDLSLPTLQFTLEMMYMMVVISLKVKKWGYTVSDD